GAGYKLDVAGNVNAYGFKVNGTTVSGNTTGAGTTNYVSKWLSASQLGNSVIYDNGTFVGIGTTTPTSLLTLNQAPGELSDNPTLSFGDGDTGFYETADDTMDLSIATILRYSWSSTAFTGTTNYGFSLLRGAGSAATPSYSFVADEDTGIYRDTANYLQFSTGATHRMTIDDSGNVGIGTTLPNSNLEVVGTFNATSNGGSIRIDSNGNVKISL
ncbi:MAG: hypothetical protein KKB79_00570, partial [Nanoarchaeota archaeon]|nr:hypothetical protein [Nanoarchaeota archaeon]